MHWFVKVHLDDSSKFETSAVETVNKNHVRRLPRPLLQPRILPVPLMRNNLNLRLTLAMLLTMGDWVGVGGGGLQLTFYLITLDHPLNWNWVKLGGVQSWANKMKWGTKVQSNLIPR